MMFWFKCFNFEEVSVKHCDFNFNIEKQTKTVPVEKSDSFLKSCCSLAKNRYWP